MAYTPTEWQTGDVVTAEKLNKIEGAIEECSSKVPSMSGLVEASTDPETDVITINKSFNDLVAITQAGVLPFLIVSTEEGTSCYTFIHSIYTDGVYVAHFTQGYSSVIMFFSSDPNSFMTTEDPGGGSTPK